MSAASPARAASASGYRDFSGAWQPFPGQPGLSFSTLYIHPSVEAGGGETFPRGGRLDVGLDGRGNILAFGPTYTFESPVFGGQFAVSLLGVFGRNESATRFKVT